MLLPLLIQGLNMGSAPTNDILSIFGMPNRPGVQILQIEVAEIQETTDVDGVMIWNQDAWDAGKVWGA